MLGDKKTRKIRKNKQLKKVAVNTELIYKIRQNSNFKDINKGKRCFILGNGPSLRNIDLSLLKNETVFSVNNFSKIDNFKDAAPEYHLWIDPAFFNMRTDMTYDKEETLRSYKTMSEVSPVCFVPDFAYDFIKENRIDEFLDINYLALFDSIKDVPMDEEDVDITSTVPTFHTVVQYAVVIAVYMGFSEIYLLGCDSTGIQTTINCALDCKNDIMHAYGNDNAEKEIKGLLSNWSMSQVFYDQYILFLGYEKLFDYCSGHGIKLVNCSDPTLITSIPKADFSEVIKKHHKKN